MSAIYPPPPSDKPPGFMDYLSSFLTGGLTGAAKTGGMQMPGWSNAIGNFLQSEPVNTAIGMTAPLKGGDVFAQRIRDLVAKMPDTGFHEGKVAIGEVYDAYRDAFPRDYQSPSGFGHRLVNAAKARNLKLDRLDLPETMEDELRKRSTTPWGNDTVHFVRKDDVE